MKRLFNLSLSYKLPLWGGSLIFMATLAVSASLMVQVYDDLRSDLLNSSVSLGRTLAANIFPLMLSDEVFSELAAETSHRCASLATPCAARRTQARDITWPKYTRARGGTYPRVDVRSRSSRRRSRAMPRSMAPPTSCGVIS